MVDAGYNAMVKCMRRNYCILLVVLLLVWLPLFAQTEYLLPIDSHIGQIVLPEPGSVEYQAHVALSSPYSLTWIETFVPEFLRSGFTFAYDDLLSGLLPVSQLQIGRAMQRGHLFEVPFTYHEPYNGWGTTIWMLNEDEHFVLLSISLEQ